jgi:hypothetical protein
MIIVVIGLSNILLLVLLLHPSLSVSFSHDLNILDLLHSFLFGGNELIDEQIFTNQDALLINDIIEFSFFLLDHVFLVLLFILILIFVIKVFLLLLVNACVLILVRILLHV